MANPTFLILGGYGNTGYVIARLVAQRTDARIVLAGRSMEKAQAAAARLNDEFGGGRAVARRADAADAASLSEAFEGVDFVLVASTTAKYTRDVAAAALAAGADYLDVMYSPQKNAPLLALAPEIERAGRCFITEAGLHPGLPSALVRWASARVGRLERATVAGLLNMGRGIPYTESLEELVESFKDFQALEYREGAWRKWGSLAYRGFDFGPEFGRRGCIAMMLDEMRVLPEMIPSLEATGFYIAGWNWFTDWVLSPLMILALKLFPHSAVKPMARLMHWSFRFSKPPYGVVLKLDAVGVADDGPREMGAVLFHEDGYFFTAAPVVACLLQYLDGTARKPGLWMMGHMVDPVRLMKDMESMGIRVHVTEGRNEQSC